MLQLRRFLSTLSLFLLCLLPHHMTMATEQLFSPAPQATIVNALGSLNLGEINIITQSQDGFIWLGTNDGLVRFDGYQAKRFTHQPDNRRSLSHDVITSIVEDTKGSLWIATKGGLNKYDPQTEQFDKIDLRRSPNDHSITDTIYQLSIDVDNTLWIGTANGLRLLDTSNKNVIELPEVLHDLPANEIVGIFFDSRGHVWFTTLSGRVIWYDNKQTIHLPIAGRGDNKAHSITEDNQGSIWLGTAQGLQRFDHNNRRFEQLTSPSKPATQITNQSVTALQLDHKGNLWLGTLNHGVHLFSPTSEVFKSLSGSNDLQQAFKENKINDIFADQQGSIWIATPHGIILVTKTALDIQYLTNASASLNITDIDVLTNDKVAFAGNYQYYEYDLTTQSAASRFENEHRLYRLSADQHNNLWLATLGQGLQQSGTEAEQLNTFRHAKPLYSDVDITGLFDVFIDNQQKVWLLPFPDLPHLAGGLIHFDHNNELYETYLSSPFISDIVQMDDGKLFLSSDSAGLLSLNTQTKVTTHWQQSIDSSPRRIFTLFKDSSNRLWLGTRGRGLALFDPITQKFSYFTTKDGLLSNDIHSIVEDKNHHLWLGTANGISRFNPQNKAVMNLNKKAGLLFSEVNKRTAIKTPDDTIVMGTKSGLVMLKPSDFSTQPAETQVYISDFKLGDQSVDWRDKSPENPLKRPLAYTQALTLSPEHYMFSFSFSAKEFVQPQAVRFAYKMQGLNQQWLHTNANNRVASYTTLRPGQYIFMVKASNSDGSWSNHVATMHITIESPWWLTWPAYMLYTLLVLACIYLFTQLRTHKLVQRSQELEKSVKQRTQELRNSRDQITDLLAQKQQLFASVSHEFRTPLTLILSPIDQLLNNEKGRHITKELTLIKRSGRRLLKMVDQLLEFAKLELHDETQMEQVSLKQTLDIMMSSFEPLAQSKKIRLTISSYEDATLNVLPDSLNKILINILSNAFKYSPANTHIFISVTKRIDKVEIAIADTGIGIGENDLEAVFERFNRATHNHSEAIPGAGIGLALVKELVEANHGTITLSSELHQGSTFTVTLPIITSHEVLSTHQDQSLQATIDNHFDLEMDTVHNLPQDVVQQEQQSDSQQKSILIVDDNPDLRTLLSEQLNGRYHCLLAENGEVGLSIAREQLPDMILSDVMMPVMDGYQLTRELKNNEMTSHIPIILLTAKGSMESRLKGLQLQVDDYLAKPFNIEELTLRINNILTIRDIVKQRFKQVIDELDPQPQMDKLNANEVEQAFINKVNEQLSQNYVDSAFSAKRLSRALHVSERQLQRKLKAQFDLGFPELLRNYRLNQAIDMLTKGQKASQIYHDVGFSSHSYFSSCFKAKFGRTPKESQQTKDIDSPS